MSADIAWIYKAGKTIKGRVLVRTDINAFGEEADGELWVGVRDLFGWNRVQTVVDSYGSLWVCAYDVVNSVGDARRYESAEAEIEARWPNYTMIAYVNGAEIEHAKHKKTMPMIPAWQALIAWPEYAKALADGALMVQQIAMALSDGRKWQYKYLLRFVGNSPLNDECLEGTLLDLVGAGLLERDDDNYCRRAFPHGAII